jgi:hypothetical protein
MFDSTIDGLLGSASLRRRVWSVPLIKDVPATASTIDRECSDCSSHAAIERAQASPRALMFHVKRASGEPAYPPERASLTIHEELRFT